MPTTDSETSSDVSGVVGASAVVVSAAGDESSSSVVEETCDLGVGPKDGLEDFPNLFSFLFQLFASKFDLTRGTTASFSASVNS